MSTREMALRLFNRLSEKQLEGFIALFSAMDDPSAQDADLVKRRALFAEMGKLRRPMPGLDEKKELAEYRKEKYGI